MSKTETRAAELIDVTAIEDRFKDEPTENLRAHFLECYNGAANLLAEAAVCLKILKGRGDNLAGLPMVGTFLRIAEGQILPELVWQFIESRNRQIVERLPKTAQEDIVANPMVPVVEAKPGGGWTKRMYDLRTAPPDIVKVAVSDEGVRTTEEQQVYLATQKPRPVAKKQENDSEEDIQEPLSHQVVVRLTASEMEALRIRAALNHTTERGIARRFLLSSGALKRPDVKGAKG